LSRTASARGTFSACSGSRPSSYATTHGSGAASDPAESNVTATTSGPQLILRDTTMSHYYAASQACNPLISASRGSRGRWNSAREEDGSSIVYALGMSAEGLLS